MLQLLRDLKAGRLDVDPEITEELLAENDAFGTGCVMSILMATPITIQMLMHRSNQISQVSYTWRSA